MTDEISILELRRTKRRAYYVANRDVILAKRATPEAREKKNNKRRADYQENEAFREKAIATSRAAREKNRDKINARRQELYRAKDDLKKKQDRARRYAEFQRKMQDEVFREQILSQRKICYTARKVNVVFRLARTLRSRLNNAVKGFCKSARTMQLVGCSIDFLKAHLEKQFVPGMTWENYGEVWHVDHILPCAEFHLQHSEEQEICFNWSNLQPLFAKDNLSKSDKIL